MQETPTILLVAETVFDRLRLQPLAAAAAAAGQRAHWLGPAGPVGPWPADGPIPAPARAPTLARVADVIGAALPAGTFLVVIAGADPLAYAAALAACARGLPVARVDAGCRVHAAAADRLRRAVDHAATLWLPATAHQELNLRREGVPARDLRVVGSLLAEGMPRATSAAAAGVLLRVREGAEPLRAALLPVAKAAGHRLRETGPDPAELAGAAVLVTDDDDWQEAACVLSVPCVTVAPHTARPETVDCGANQVAGPEPAAAARALSIALGAVRQWQSPYAAGAAAAALAAIQERLSVGDAIAAPEATVALPSDGDWTGRTLGAEECELAARAIRSGTLNSTKGTFVTRFEREFAAMTGRRFAIACASGSAAVHAAIAALGLSAGDEVVTTPITDMGALTCILYEGALPVFADVAPESLNVTSATLAAQLTDRTRAIVVTHLFGLPCDMPPIMALANSRGLPVIEDMAQALGAEVASGRLGAFGALACYSLQQGKHITTGEGGVVTTDDPALARTVRLFVNKAWGYGDERPDHYFPAPNYRLTELQGAVGTAQLRKLAWVVARRREVAAALTRGLGGVPGLQLPQDPPGGRHAWWRYALHVEAELVAGGAAELGARIRARGVACQPRYIQKPAFECKLFLDFRAHPVTALPLEHNPRRDRPQPLFDRAAYPGAVRGLERVIVLPLNELWGPEHVAFVTGVIAAEAEVLAHA